MKHTIGIELVDPTGKPFSTIHTTRGLTYDTDEISHKQAEANIRKLAREAHGQSLKEAMGKAIGKVEDVSHMTLVEIAKEKANEKFKHVNLEVTEEEVKAQYDSMSVDMGVVAKIGKKKVSRQPATTNGWTAEGDRESIDAEMLRKQTVSIYKKLHIKGEFKLGGWRYWLGEKGLRAYRRPLK